MIIRKSDHETLQSYLQAEPLYDKLVAVLADAAAINYSTPLVEKAKEITHMITQRVETRAQLKSGTEHSNRQELEAAIGRAESIGLESTEPVLVAARQELQRILQEEQLVAALVQALSVGFAQRTSDTTWDHLSIDANTLASAIYAAESFGFHTEHGRQILDEAKIIVDIRYCAALSCFRSVLTNAHYFYYKRQNLIAEDYDALSRTLKRATALPKNSTSQSTKTEIGSYKLSLITPRWNLI